MPYPEPSPSFTGGHLPAPISGCPDRVPSCLILGSTSLSISFLSCINSFLPTGSLYLPSLLLLRVSRFSNRKAKLSKLFLAPHSPPDMGLKLYPIFLQNLLEVVIYSCHLPSPASYSLFHSLPLSSVSPPSEMTQGDGSWHSGCDLQRTGPNGHFAVPAGTLQEYRTVCQALLPEGLFLPFVSVTPKSSFCWLALSSLTLNIGALFYIYSPRWWFNPTTRVPF